MENGIIYRGPSLLDGSPIVAIATYSARNRKTGAMVQTYIIRDDMDPVTASRTGADAAICGACPLRGKANPAKAVAKATAAITSITHDTIITANTESIAELVTEPSRRRSTH